MVKRIMIVVFLLITISIPTFAEEPGIHGKLACKYELLNHDPGQEWIIDLHYNFTSWLSAGAEQITVTNGLGANGFIPTMQKYDIYLKIDINKNIIFKLSQWCDHPVTWQYKNARDDDYYNNIPDIKYGICLYGEYRF
jgi:hypothetical protein